MAENETPCYPATYMYILNEFMLREETLESNQFSFKYSQYLLDEIRDECVASNVMDKRAFLFDFILCIFFSTNTSDVFMDSCN